MRLVQLAAKAATRRGGVSQADCAGDVYGSQPGGTGSRTIAVVRVETDIGGGKSGTKRHPTLSEVKRWAKEHGANLQGLAYDMLGRD